MRSIATVLLLSASAVLTAGAPASAVEIEKPATTCAFRAWSKDPGRLNVRAAPRADGAVIARLPPPLRDGSDSYSPEMKIIGAKNGWLLIDGAEIPELGVGKAGPPFLGRGWVSGAMVDVSAQDERVRSAPDAAATVVDAPREDAARGKEFLKLRRIWSCQGKWAEVEGDFVFEAADPGRRARGWVTELCGNQVTTCP
jgi:hypothetical protein